MTSCSSESRGDESIFSSIAGEIISEFKAVIISPPDQPMVKYRTIEWTELMPKDDLEAILNQPDYIDEIVDGSPEDQLSSRVKSAIAMASDSRYQQALESTRVIEEFNNQPVRIAGFIVPLEFDGEQTITQFFFVPYFGACIHLPPPPPNQLIYVSYPQGLKLDALYDPFWITGVIKTSLVENDTATSAYSIVVNSISPYVPD
ncbi:conserved hypothetical protein [Oleispira antarctica RB-8]|uniref:Lipoprotein n=1 Tax=Oleispira antarctica RB-8 TaxID=698738 RepID=R4YMM3_OLEAN|nr:conserved hypothetical protein [Oleispira antarctica RB-8]